MLRTSTIATYGPAVEISPSIFEDSYQGFLPMPLFINNKFENNSILKGRSKAVHVTQGLEYLLSHNLLCIFKATMCLNGTGILHYV